MVSQVLSLLLMSGAVGVSGISDVAVAERNTYGVTVGGLAEHIRVLVSPEMEGRLTLAPGERKAADYLAREFARIGLAEGPNKGFIHEFDITVNARPTENNKVVLRHSDGRTWDLKLGADFMPLNGTATVSGKEAGVVFVGFGLGSAKWDDYAGVDVSGKYVLMFRGVPEGHEMVRMRDKAALAKEKGAIGILTIGPREDSALPRPTRGAGFPTELGLVGVGLHGDLSDELKGVGFGESLRMSKPASRVLPVTATVTAEMVANAGRGLNVIGYLPGNDPVLKNEYIVVGAHYDHLGFGEVGSRTGREIIHPGADDNASGVAAVIALAEYFARTKSNRRTIIFQLYSGEEVGLVGAFAWVRDFPEKTRATSAMINMDMIGRLRDGNLTVFSTSSSVDFDAILRETVQPGINLRPVPTVASNSDHAAFARANVPNLFFHTGLTEEYHTEDDTFETLNMEGMVLVTQMVGATVEAIDSRPKLAWNPAVQMAQRGGGARRVVIGFMPDMGDTSGPGVRLQGVTDGSPAAQAGLRAGDRVVKVGSRDVTGLESLQAAFADLRPGQAVTVVVMRDGQRMEVNLTPRAAS